MLLDALHVFIFKIIKIDVDADSKQRAVNSGMNMLKLKPITKNDIEEIYYQFKITNQLNNLPN